MRYKDKYPNITKANLTVDEIAKIFKYKTTSALRCSTKYHIIMSGVDTILGMANEQHVNRLADLIRELS